jgi:NitT/TauT family transport system ATP-binding protein
MRLEARAVAKTYAARSGPLAALAPVSFTVEGGECVSLLGPSGCGKSTVLQMIAGLTEPSAGQILLDGSEIDGPGRDRGMVFQNYTLFPWLNVRQNAEFAGQLRANAANSGGSAVDPARVTELLELVGLADFHTAYPRELSGGMQQRVAIVRALANRPKLLLMDEPFGALDAQTRQDLQELMLVLQVHEPTTIVFVTHDIEEALYLSTRILVFSGRPGRVLRDVAVPFGPASERRAELKLSSEFAARKRELIALLQPGPLTAVRAARLDHGVHSDQ